MRLQSSFFNTYLIIKSCWVILLFNIIGFFMLAVFNQGQDVLRSLGFVSGEYQNRRHTLFLCIMLLHWSWQNFRSTRIITHTKTFHFSEFYRPYSSRTLVIFPRILAILPFIIISYATYKANSGYSSLIFVYLSMAVWVYLFLVYRRKIIVYLITKRIFGRLFLDYVPVKNSAYPPAFIISKQILWIFFRIFLFILTFVLIFLFPYSFPAFIGPGAIVVLALANWLLFFTLLALFERRFKVPLVFILFLCLFVFSYFNDNHLVRLLEKKNSDERPYVDTYINKWLTERKAEMDTIPVYLVAAEGGGIRAAYWANEVLNKLSRSDKDFHKKVLAYSSVSGGSLGTIAFNIGAVSYRDPITARTVVRNFLRNDFLSPIMAYAMFPDGLQRFLPFPITSFDRAAILEKTWEKSWEACSPVNSEMFAQGYLNADLYPLSGTGPMFFLNATHIESGNRVLVSPVKFGVNQFYETQDFIELTGRDLRLSTAVLLSSRFPYVTPAALVKDTANNSWGHIGDGGYYENLGISTLLDVYNRLKTISEVKNIPVKVSFLFIRNTKNFSDKTTLRSMYELMTPVEAYLNVWYKSGTYNLNMIKGISFGKNDRILNFALPRFENDIVPLGWTMSKQATDFINSQVENVVSGELKGAN
ncbi:MAG: patatin-like phospholipase family protein [Flavobacteriales bacterium]|nr:patatin-like phospholipase family protein [Flavobacteriales bacterium]